MVWKPFDLRCGDIIDRMKVRQELVQFELSIQGIKHARSEQENMKAEGLRLAIERKSAALERQESEKGRWTTNETRQLLEQENQGEQ